MNNLKPYLQWPSSIDAVLFDHDGTLVDSEIMHYNIWVKLLRPFGYQLTPEHYNEKMAGVPTEQSAQYLVHQFDMPVGPQLLAQQKNYETLVALQTSSIPLRPGVKEILQFLNDKKIPCAIVTGSSRKDLNYSLAAHQIQNFFQFTVTQDDVRLNKPNPEPYILALKLLNMHPQQVLAIEDAQHGLLASSTAGIATVCIPTAYSKYQDFQRSVWQTDSMAHLHTRLLNL